MTGRMRLLALALIFACSAARAEPIRVKIGVLTDMTSLYADIGGLGSVAAAKLAIADFTRDHPDVAVELIAGDTENKPDIGARIASQWYDVEAVDMIIDVPNSAVAGAVSQVANQKDKALIVSTAGDAALTGAKCNANTVHWTYDTWMLANVTGKAVVKTGGDSWFFITADYAFGRALEANTEGVVIKNGGAVLGKVLHPLNAKDFSLFLLEAQASHAKIIGLANAGDDTVNAIKQAAELAIGEGGQNLVGLLVFVSDVASLGLQTAQGLMLTETWYWDMNDANRTWTRRWQAERGATGKFPTMAHAGVYSGVMHYLKARLALGPGAHDGQSAVAMMKSTPTDDPLFGKGAIRADGRKLHPAYLFEVKKPAESKYAGDFYQLRATIPADEAFRPLKDGGCALVKE